VLKRKSAMMEFPPYVPLPVRQYVEDTNEKLQLDNDDRLRINRFAFDPRMQEVFILLSPDFDDKSWRGFIYAAWASKCDFRPYRERVRRAQELSDEIANTAKQLAKLLRQVVENGLNVPEEFYSIRDLLRKTENHELQGHNLHVWKAMRDEVLGDLPQQGQSEEIINWDETSEVEIIYRDPTPEEQAFANINYAWEKAPTLSAVLDTVAASARKFRPRETRMIAAANESRQSNEKTEYLRAFGDTLRNVHRIPFTRQVLKGMAIVANVAIDDPNIDATYDDVRKLFIKYVDRTSESRFE